MTFNSKAALNSQNPQRVGCGRCTGCRIQHSESWAIRCVHESKLYEKNSFITLTYANEHLPDDYSVSKREWQLFMKRLREGTSHQFRFFACGEYGDLNYRPHYHALLFNYDVSDKVLYSEERGNKLYTSKTLSKFWPYGLATLGAVTYQSAAYCTRYVMKKMTGDKADDHYWRINPLTQQLVRQAPEFALMSRMPGLGSGWFDKFKSDVFPSDFIIMNGTKKPVPEYYLKKLAEEDQTIFKRSRKAANKFKQEHQDERKRRLTARRVIRDQALTKLLRSMKDHDQ